MKPSSASPPEPVRLRGARLERESREQGVIAREPGRLFIHYLEGAGGADCRLPMAVRRTDEVLGQNLAEQLTLRLSGVSQWPLQVGLYLPRLGRINVTARRGHDAWDISLQAEEAATSTWLVGMRQGCEERLSRALGHPVGVQVVPVGNA